MPFTFVHPAIVIPCKKVLPKYFDITALVLGSMAPDFEYFLRFRPKGEIGHTLLGVFYFDLPMVLILYILWNFIVKKPLILNMPHPIDKKFNYLLNEKIYINNLRYLSVFVVSALIGVYSHILWDAFTHKTGFFVQHVDLLANNINIMSLKVPIYKVLQHGSTLIGAIYIIRYMNVIMDSNINKIKSLRTKVKIGYWMSIISMTLLITICRILFTLSCFNLKYFGIYIVSIISSGIVSILIVSLTFSCKYKNENFY